MEGKEIFLKMEMTDQEFDVLDELYFVQSYEFLVSEVDLEFEEIKEALQSLLEKKYIKCLSSMDEEVFEQELDFENNYASYFYLATKAGLLVHNMN